MKTLRLVLASAVAIFALAGVAHAGDAGGDKAKCCAKAAADGKSCEHGCCVEAAKAGKNCEKCGGKNQSKT